MMQWSQAGFWRITILQRGRILPLACFNQRFGLQMSAQTSSKVKKAVPGDFLNCIVPVDKRINDLGLYIKDSKDALVDFEILGLKISTLFLGQRNGMLFPLRQLG